VRLAGRLLFFETVFFVVDARGRVRLVERLLFFATLFFFADALGRARLAARVLFFDVVVFFFRGARARDFAEVLFALFALVAFLAVLAARDRFLACAIFSSFVNPFATYIYLTSPLRGF
jgi:hypothetical protein